MLPLLQPLLQVVSWFCMQAVSEPQQLFVDRTSSAREMPGRVFVQALHKRLDSLLQTNDASSSWLQRRTHHPPNLSTGIAIGVSREQRIIRN